MTSFSFKYLGPVKKLIYRYISFDAAFANAVVLWGRVGVGFKLYC